MSLELKLLLGLWCHVAGDYVLQSDYMALKKSTSKWVAALHAFFYTLPFLLLTRSPVSLWLIFLTHAVIDHYRLARYVCWAKNFLAPAWLVPLGGILERYREVTSDEDDGVNPESSTWLRNYRWADCKATGYYDDRPPFLSVWLLIITDNFMHITINSLCLYAFN